MVQRDEHQHGARLGISGDVRQRVRLAEAFIAGRADAAGDVHLPLDGIGPHPLRRVEVVADTGQDADIGERHHQRDAVHRMADRLALFQHRLVGLVVPAAIDGVLEAADVEIVLRQIEMLLVSRRPIELRRS